MTEISPTHTLQDQDQIDAIAKRMKRAQGQMGAVVRMLEEGRSCEDVVTQLAAINKAVTTAGFILILLVSTLLGCSICAKSSSGERYL